MLIYYYNYLLCWFVFINIMLCWLVIIVILLLWFVFIIILLYWFVMIITLLHWNWTTNLCNSGQSFVVDYLNLNCWIIDKWNRKIVNVGKIQVKSKIDNQSLTNKWIYDFFSQQNDELFSVPNPNDKVYSKSFITIFNTSLLLLFQYSYKVGKKLNSWNSSRNYYILISKQNIYKNKE